MKVGGLFGVGGGVLEANVGIISWSLVPALHMDLTSPFLPFSTVFLMVILVENAVSMILKLNPEFLMNERTLSQI